MARKQVELNLGTPALSPTVQRAGQYNVAVQPTPKTNSALQLAQALRYTPQVLGQASNIAKGMGAEAASQVTNVEEALQDKETKGILGYDKAYQQGLVKRHFSANEDVIRQRFNNLASSPEYMAMDTNQFVAALQGEREKFIGELMDEFGGNANREQAITVLSNTFVDSLIDDTSVKWLENRQNVVITDASAEAQKIMSDPNRGVAEAMKYLRGELGAVGTDFKTVGAEMRNSVRAAAMLAVEEGQFEKAEKIVAQAEQYNVTGKASLLGSTEGKELKVQMLRTIEQGRLRAERVAQEAGIDFSDIATVAIGNLNKFSTKENVSKAAERSIKDAISYLAPNQDIEELYDKVWTGQGYPQNNLGSLLQELGVNGSDTARDAYYDSAASIAKKLEFIQNTPINPVNLTSDYKEKKIAEFEQWERTKTEAATAEDWINETQQPFRPFDELNERSNELAAGNFVRDTDQFKRLRSQINEIADTVEEASQNESFALNETLLTNLQTQIEGELLSYARSVAKEPNAKDLVINKHTELVELLTERLNGLRAASDTVIDATTDVERGRIEDAPAKAIKGSGRSKTSIKYKTLEGRKRKGREPSWSEINKERKTMLENRHFSQLRLSLYRSGFSSYSPENVEMMQEVGLDAGDVKLIADPRQGVALAKSFEDVLKADTGFNTLTAEQREIRKQYQTLGIETQDDIDNFLKLQLTILNSSR